MMVMSFSRQRKEKFSRYTVFFTSEGFYDSLPPDTFWLFFIFRSKEVILKNSRMGI